jgi:hypothetical protein
MIGNIQIGRIATLCIPIDSKAWQHSQKRQPEAGFDVLRRFHRPIKRIKPERQQHPKQPSQHKRQRQHHPNPRTDRNFGPSRIVEHFDIRQTQPPDHPAFFFAV